MSDALDTQGRIAPAGSDGVRTAGAGRGSAPPPPPPAPHAGNVDPRVLRDQIRATQRQLRDRKRAERMAQLKGVHRQWWYLGGAIVAVGALAVGCRSYAADQRETALALASMAADKTPTNSAAVVQIDGIPNPLDQLELSGQARWTIGVDGSGAMLPQRSAAVVAEILRTVNLCNVFVGLDEKAAVRVAMAPAPGYVPLTACKPAAAVTTTTVRAS